MMYLAKLSAFVTLLGVVFAAPSGDLGYLICFVAGGAAGLLHMAWFEEK
jgi:hypothetical protein